MNGVKRLMQHRGGSDLVRLERGCRNGCLHSTLYRGSASAVQGPEDLKSPRMACMACAGHDYLRRRRGPAQRVQLEYEAAVRVCAGALLGAGQQAHQKPRSLRLDNSSQCPGLPSRGSAAIRGQPVWTRHYVIYARRRPARSLPCIHAPWVRPQAEYETDSNAVNQVVLWDHIVEKQVSECPGALRRVRCCPQESQARRGAQRLLVSPRCWGHMRMVAARRSVRTYPCWTRRPSTPLWTAGVSCAGETST
jgi:hypothetical protein